MKLCIDCRHILYDALHPRDSQCARALHPVGTTESCRWERTGGWLSARLEGCCGREGRFHEPRVNAPGV
jgi:hypothetical protein